MFTVTIKHVVSIDPSSLVLLNRIADALEGKTQAEIDKAADALGAINEALKVSDRNLLAALAKK